MIDANRPVRGQDLNDVREKLALSVEDMCWLLGMTMPRWSIMTRDENALNTISDTTVAILVRILDEFPEFNFVPTMPSPQDIFEALVSLDSNITMKEASILLGREGSSCFHWIKRGRRAAPSVLRLGRILLDQMNGDMRAHKNKFLNYLRSIVVREANCRGQRDIFGEGSWTVKIPGQPSTRGRKKKVTEEQPASE